MTKITNQLWIGDSQDAEHADLHANGISAILNVAHDLQCRRGWTDHVLYAQCGIVDGPGSTMAAYHSALLQLCSLMNGGRVTLVVDHDGTSRAVAVAVMALNVVAGRFGWDHWVWKIKELRGLADGFSPHEIHRKAFNRINWRLIGAVMTE